MNILVTVGAQLPFSRLIRCIDRINAHKEHDIFAQIGQDDGSYINMNTTTFLTAVEYKSKLDWCDLVIAHAGMGTIIQCLELNKKLIVVPRLKKFSEHRNDHQLDTVEKFVSMTSSDSLFKICHDIDDLERLLVEVCNLRDSNPFFSLNNDDWDNNIGKYVRMLVENEV